MQKVHDPQPGKIITLTLGNIGSGALFFVKCRCYTLQEDYITTTTFGTNQYMSGTWWYRGEKKQNAGASNERMPGDFSETIIGIAKIVGYK